MLVLYQQIFDAKHATDLTQLIYSIHSEWSAHLDRGIICRLVYSPMTDYICYSNYCSALDMSLARGKHSKVHHGFKQALDG